MIKSIFNTLTGLGAKLEGPEYLKAYESNEAIINEMKSLAEATKDESLKQEILRDCMLIQYGDAGEKNVAYELSHSFLPMYILHNVVLKTDDYKAQIDYVILTHKFILILETKRLNGDITVNNQGDFIRTFRNSNGKKIKDEGMYSPITQNHRHVKILQEMLIKTKLIKNTPILSLIVIANPKSMIDMKFAKKEVKDQIVKHDQLNQKIKDLLARPSEVNLQLDNVKAIGQFLVMNHYEEESTFASKYKSRIESENLIEELVSGRINVSLGQESVVDKTIAEKVPLQVEKVQDSQGDGKKSPIIEQKREALIAYRLEISRKENIKAYMVFNNNQMEELLDKMPKNDMELLDCNGFGPEKVKKYGKGIVEVLGR